MRRAYQRPLASYLADSSQQKLAKSSALLDLGYHHSELRCVRGVVGKPLSHNHLAIGIHNGLSVVTLNKPVVAFHDPALGIGEVGLSRILGSPGLVLPRSTRTATLFLFAFLARLCLRFSFQSSAGFSGLFQPTLLVPHPIGQFLSALIRSVLLIFPSISGLRLAQPAADNRLQFCFSLLHPPVAHGLVLRSVGLQLSAVQSHVPKLHQPRLLAQPQNLYEQFPQCYQMPLAKITDRAK